MDNLHFIVACAQDNAIGYKGDMLFHLPKDLQFFKKTTMGGILVMGRRTLESLPGILPGRLHFVVSRSQSYHHPSVRVFKSYDALFNALAQEEKPAFLAGGGKVYHDLLAYCQAGYRTVVDATSVADTYFPTLEEVSSWHLDKILEEGLDGNYTYRIERWQNSEPHSFIKRS